jgi:hypothetical protein
VKWTSERGMEGGVGRVEFEQFSPLLSQPDTDHVPTIDYFFRIPSLHTIIPSSHHHVTPHQEKTSQAPIQRIIYFLRSKTAKDSMWDVREPCRFAGDSVETQSTRSSCRIKTLTTPCFSFPNRCHKEQSKYICPRCNIFYCSLACFRAEVNLAVGSFISAVVQRLTTPTIP